MIVWYEDTSNKQTLVWWEGQEVNLSLEMEEAENGDHTVGIREGRKLER